MKRFLLFITIFFYIYISFSEEKAVKKDYLSMKITPEIGFVNGWTKEFVFSSYCLNSDNKLSELDWELKNIPAVTLIADFDILDRVYLGITGRVGLPFESGNMTDYDWMNSVVNSWKYSNPCELTNYSCHDNKLNKMISLMIRLGWNFFLPAEIKISPYAAYQYDYLGFDASNGYYIYKSEQYKPGSFTGKVISYHQEMNSIIAGVKVNMNLIPRTSIEADLNFSPALTFLNAYDYHYLNTANGNGTAYWDKLNNIWLIQARMEIQYRFNKKHSSGLSGSIHYIPRSKGSTSSKSLGSNGLPGYGKWSTSSSDTGGTERLIWSINLNYSFSL